MDRRSVRIRPKFPFYFILARSRKFSILVHDVDPYMSMDHDRPVLVSTFLVGLKMSRNRTSYMSVTRSRIDLLGVSLSWNKFYDRDRKFKLITLDFASGKT